MPDQNATIINESNANNSSEDLFLEDDLNDMFDGQGEHDDNVGNDDDEFSDDDIDEFDDSDSRFGQTTEGMKHEHNLQISNQQRQSHLLNKDESDYIAESAARKKAEAIRNIQNVASGSIDQNAIKSSNATLNNDDNRQSLLESLDTDDEMGSAPLPSWQCEDVDKEHRRAMILEIARLLQARKKKLPSEEWLHQLPHKARKLEGRLYRIAPSLESYLERSTLKVRLSSLANAITQHYGDTSSRRESSSTISTLPRLSLSKLAKRDSMRASGISRSSEFDSRASLLSIASSIDTTRSLNQAMQQATVNGVLQGVNTDGRMKGLSLAVSQHNPHQQTASAVTESDGNANNKLNRERPSVIVIENNKGNSRMNETSGHRTENQSSASSCNSNSSGNKLPQVDSSMQQIQMQPTLFHQKGRPTSSPSMGGMPSSSAVGLTSAPTDSKSPLLNFGGMSGPGRYDQSISTSAVPSDANASRLQGSSQSELERQKAVNAKLQQQIMHNIRLQEDLVRRLQATAGSQTSVGEKGTTDGLPCSGMNTLRGSNLNTQMPSDMQGSLQNVGNSVDSICSPNMNQYMRSSVGTTVNETDTSFFSNSIEANMNGATSLTSSNNVFNRAQSDLINQNNRGRMSIGFGEADFFNGENNVNIQNNNSLGGSGMLGMMNTIPHMASHSNTINNPDNGNNLQYLMAAQQLQNRGVSLSNFPMNETAPQHQMSQQQLFQQHQIQLMRQSLQGSTSTNDNNSIMSTMQAFHQQQPAGTDPMAQLQNSNLMLNSNNNAALMGIGAAGAFSNREMVNGTSRVNGSNNNNESGTSLPPGNFYW